MESQTFRVVLVSSLLEFILQEIHENPLGVYRGTPKSLILVLIQGDQSARSPS